MSARPTSSTVAAYLDALTPQQRKVLKSVLAQVRKTVPDSTPVMSYGIPALKLQRVFIYCAAFKRHVGIYPPVQDDAKLIASLEPYANAKGNLSFPLDQPMPMVLIAKVAHALAKRGTGPLASVKRKAKKGTS